ncbi:hypothetical protein [Ureibacillus massiliensis]|nr:hypothetical protein [Ureibacillus massiliensis]
MSDGDLYSYDYDTSGRLKKAISPNYTIQNEYGLTSDYEMVYENII